MIVHRFTKKEIALNDVYSLAKMEKRVYDWNIEQTMEAMKTAFEFDYDTFIIEDEDTLRKLLISDYIKTDRELSKYSSLMYLLERAIESIATECEPRTRLNAYECVDSKLLKDVIQDILKERCR